MLETYHQKQRKLRRKKNGTAVEFCSSLISKLFDMLGPSFAPVFPDLKGFIDTIIDDHGIGSLEIQINLLNFKFN